MKELMTADIKDSSAEHDFNSSRLSQQIDNVSENEYIIWQLILTKDLILRSINQSLETGIKDSSSKVNLKSIFMKKIILNLINQSLETGTEDLLTRVNLDKKLIY